MTRRITPAQRLRQQLFSLWADAAMALVNGDDVIGSEVRGEADALIAAFVAEQAKQREARRRRQVTAILRVRR